VGVSYGPHVGAQDTSPNPLLVPGAEPFLLRGGSIGCLLVHGFTPTPAEMRPLGDDLAAAGHTVLGVRLAGHGTEPEDLRRIRWRDWLASVADGVAVLAQLTETIVLIGQSLGAALVLTAATRLRADAVVALAPPYALPTNLRPRRLRPWHVRSKGVPLHPQLGLRREADYPAYAGFPPRVEREVPPLLAEMRRGLSTIMVPVLVVASDADPWLPASLHGRRLAAELPDARLVVLENVGHSIALDPGNAEALAAIREFVALV